ncbi:thioredoxin H2-2 isoform X1 [Setaria italica]|uniref:thioredoxin H2-2 isoform X1 n=1 Tax=Setaria italica TaxID=4555 RepID=UPI000BE5664D|nr:thioredoxin H2-2 isoform X1 [Setaria italica]XP_034574269.1 thioredoxin H2-2-like isoform X1 [Setaria viridis]
MGSFLSSLVTPPPAADDPNCAVVAAHSKATYDEQWAAAKSSGKLVSWPLPPAPLPFPFLWFSPVLGALDLSCLGCSALQMVIDFSASWCGPCRFIEPAFKEMASKYTDVAFVKIDVDELADVARTWKVEAMPTFVLAKGGKEVSRVVGAKKDELERKIGMFRSSSSY